MGLSVPTILRAAKHTTHLNHSEKKKLTIKYLL
jgi:hypothetical protein